MDRGRSFAECLGLVNGVLSLLSFVRDCMCMNPMHLHTCMSPHSEVGPVAGATGHILLY